MDVELLRAHPCIKPVEEPAFLIENLTKKGDIVLDCFCGLGSTLLAAQALYRRWIGCDLSERYCKYSMKRLRGRMPSGTAEPSQTRLLEDSQHPDKTPVEPAHKKDGTATPQWLFDVLDQQVRTLTGKGFELDAAASRHNFKCPDYYDEEIDALSRDWSDWDTVYCNPPFSAKLTGRFAEKALCAAKAGTTVVMLLPFWPGYPWFPELMRNGQMQTVIGPIAFKHDSGKTVILNKGRFSYDIVVITLGPHIRPATNGVPIYKPPRPATGPKSDESAGSEGCRSDDAATSDAPVDFNFYPTPP